MPDPLHDRSESEFQKATEKISEFLSEESVPMGGFSAESGSASADGFFDPDITEQIPAPSDSDVIPDTEKPVSRDLPQIERIAVVPVQKAGERAATPLKQPLLLQGTVLAERYEVLKNVANSSTGQIYKALDRRREKAGDSEPWVALKVAGSDTVAQGRHSTLFHEEYRTLLRLTHPNIVAAYDLCRDGNTEFMVLEWLAGQTLARLLGGINSNRLALSVAKKIVCNVAGALAHVHASGIVHGDIKPSNIFVAEDYSVKLIDFGAAPLPSEFPDSTRHPLWATKTYASCDVLLGNSPRPADDVFSLGVTAYRLFSGSWPFGEVTALAAKEKGIVPAALPDGALGCGPAVRQSLRFDSDDRPSDAAALLRLLHVDKDKREMPTWVARVEHHKTEIVAGGLALLTLVLAISWLWTGGEPAASSIDRLLDKADVAFMEGRLAEPTGESALDRYQAILAVEPSNSIALQRLDDIAARFLDQARLALKEDRPYEANAKLEEARRIRPDHLSILLFEDVLASYERDQLESERQAATVELEVLIRAIDERILSQRLLIPSGDSALDVLLHAKRFAPESQEVQRAAERIASALLFQAWFATSNGEFDAAQSYIDAAASLDARHLMLAHAKYALVKARNGAVQLDSTQERLGQ